MFSTLAFGALTQLLPALLLYPITSSAHPLETSRTSPLESRGFTFCNDEKWVQSYYFNAALVGKFPRLPAKDKVYVRDDQSGLYNDELKRDLEHAVAETGLSVRQPAFDARTWAAKSYREIAQTSGVIMIATAAGAIGDAFNIIDQGVGREIKWDGDHIFELNMLKIALLQWNDPALTTLMFTCQHVIDRFTGILNAPGNLIGVDAVINNLKMNLLQKNGPANWKAYEPSVYVATGEYLHAITNKWNTVVHQLADALDAVAHEQGLKAGVGDFIKQFAYQRFTQAFTLISKHYPVGAALLSKKWVRMPR